MTTGSSSAAVRGEPPFVDHWIDGVEVSGSASRLADVFNPATGAISARVRLADRADANLAIASARRAYPAWAATPALTRARVLRRFLALLERDADAIAALITAEHGKVLDDARGELTRGMEVVEFACGIPHLLKGEHSMNVGAGIDSWTEFAPLGVVAGITPFNFPAMVPLWMFPLALACGNTFVLKPSERDPSVALKLAALLSEAGLPPGAFNVLQGDREAVGALIESDDVAALSFVGSSAVAEQVYAGGSSRGKRVQALGSAKNHLLAMPDADPQQVASALLGAGYGSAGERCMAISVAVCVGEDCADRLAAALTPMVAALKVGAGTDAGIEMGPLISAPHRERVRALVDRGVREGAQLLVDGRALEVDAHPDGFFLGPCLFDRVTPAMAIWREEIFGPVLCIVRVADFESALELIHSHPYANGTAIFTADSAAARAFAHRIEVGMVGINVPIPVPMAFHSFGGWKASLLGPLHVHGPDGVRFYTRQKTVTARWPERSLSSTAQAAEFVMPTMK